MWNLSLLAQQFTNWGALVTCIQVSLSFYCSTDLEISKKRTVLALHHFLFQVITPMNLLIFTVYWVMLSESVVAGYKAKGESLNVLHSYWVHTAPILANLVNFLITDIAFKPMHVLFTFPIGIGYSYINYSSTISTGKPVYWFLDWKDITSPLIMTGFTFGCVFFYLFMCWLTSKARALRPRPPLNDNTIYKKSQ